MKSFSKIAAQGDVLFNKVESIPENYIEMDSSEIGYIIAHSETGHHHTVDVNSATVFFNPENPMLLFMRLKKQNAEIKHHREFDTHETLIAEGGVGSIYEIRRQREYTPEGWRRVED